MRLFYSPGYVASGHSFDTTRKARWLADSLADAPIAAVELVAPPLLTRAQLLRVHSDEYLTALESGRPDYLASSCGFPWDEGLWRAVHLQASGVVAAATAALADGVSGSLSSGLHHAHQHYGSGFCALNGLAVAAHELRVRGLEKVLVLDLDAHCGGGTHEAFLHLPGAWQLDVVPRRNHFDDYYPEAGRLYKVSAAADYLETVRNALAELEGALPGIVLYNAGVDIHEGSSPGGLSGVDSNIVQEREKLVFSWAHEREIPIAFVLAGGYSGPRLSPEELVALHRLTIAAAAELSVKVSP